MIKCLRAPRDPGELRALPDTAQAVGKGEIPTAIRYTRVQQASTGPQCLDSYCVLIIDLKDFLRYTARNPCQNALEKPGFGVSFSILNLKEILY